MSRVGRYRGYEAAYLNERWEVKGGKREVVSNAMLSGKEFFVILVERTFPQEIGARML